MGPARPRDPKGCKPGEESRQEGVGLIEVAVSFALLLTILLGVMGSLTTASAVQLNTNERVSNQMLLGQSLEELKSVPFSTLTSFNGTHVISGKNRVDFLVTPLSAALVRVEVVSTSSEYSDITNRAVLLLVNPD